MLPLPIPFAVLIGELWGYELPFWADKAAWSPEPVPAMALEREVVLVLQRCSCHGPGARGCVGIAEDVPATCLASERTGSGAGGRGRAGGPPSQREIGVTPMTSSWITA